MGCGAERLGLLIKDVVGWGKPRDCGMNGEPIMPIRGGPLIICPPAGKPIGAPKFCDGNCWKVGCDNCDPG